MKCSLILMALVSSIGGCAQYRNIDVDYKYTEEELVIIERSVNEWHKATGSESANITLSENMVIGDGVFHYEDYDWTTDFGTATMQKVSKIDPGYPILVKDFGENVGGVGREGELIITITEHFYNGDIFVGQRFHQTVLHELGHFFGLKHEDGTLMNPNNIGIPACIDQDTLNNFCIIHGDCWGQKPTCD